VNAEKIVGQIDEQGYAVLRKGVSAELVDQYKTLIEPLKLPPEERPKGIEWPQKAECIHLEPNLFTWVMQDPRIRRVVHILCGDHARLDNHFLLTYPGEGARPNVHGGPFSERGSVYYQSQGYVRQASNLKVGIALHDQCGPGVIPGSHTSNRAFRTKMPKRSPDELYCPGLKAGQILIFADALIHGTPNNSNFRQLLYYTFTPGHIAWARHRDVEPEVFEKIPDKAKGYFKPPGLVELTRRDRAAGHWTPRTLENK